MSSSFFHLITQANLLDWLGSAEIAKGVAYLERVSELQLSSDERHLSASVKGNRRTSYLVLILASDQDPAQSRLRAHCSCPVGHRCKHIAATLLRWLKERDRHDGPRPQVRAWVEALRSLRQQAEANATTRSSNRPNRPSHALRYCLRPAHNQRSHHELVCLKARIGRAGDVRQAESWTNIERALLTPPSFVDDIDLAILRLLWAQRDSDERFSLHGRHESELLERLIASGRCHYLDLFSPALHPGAERPGRACWQLTEQGQHLASVLTEPAADVILATDPLYYLDRSSGESGRISLQTPGGLVQRLLWLPALSEEESGLVADALAEYAPELPLPWSGADAPELIDGSPTPLLSIATTPVHLVNYRDYAPYGTWELDFATPGFRYGPLSILSGDSRRIHRLADGRAARIERDSQAEQALLKRLQRCGLKPIPPGKVLGGELDEEPWGLASEQAWPQFMAETLPQLRAEGWEISFADDFRHHATDIDQLLLDVDQDEQGWLSLSPGVEIEQRTVPLAPLLGELFARDPRWLGGDLRSIADEENIVLDGGAELGRLRIRAARLKPLVATLVDLFDRPDGEWKLSPFDSPRLADLELPGRGQAEVAAFARRLREVGSIAAVSTPAGFAAELRPYQLEGLAWLQHLVRHQLAGILADDMGLGKTAQTLAHLLTEKLAGRLQQPALVVLPTSLVFNWQAEAERFAPQLKVLSLHGADRQARFDELAAADRDIDVCLSTYPLLWRDAEQLGARQWSLLILDEAQTVKNVTSRAAQVIRQLRADHRLALTGTPLENHLGELWAQFDFLLPGFLGTQKQFTTTWRTPIEKHGDEDRRALLAARLKPFILRRRKEDVATELPPKTVIVRNINLEGGQRDLYETVRAAMDEKVRKEIAGKGCARSQIVILDALLKLRQVCCDPRLLKTSAAAKVKEHAKLDLLMEMLPELIDEGRRILVFSQFTTMLSLIAGALDKAKIGWVALTGETRDRRIPVEDFQQGRVPVFLISLKAGGVGLNLTAADTVIHFDPWWNPAAENQATDRAHRIGQDKPVFVFKLICAGSIEERILALQERKAALAAGVLSEDSNALAKFGEDDIAALLAPLPPAR